MHDDEQEIRRLVDSWLAASRDGDVDAVLALVADDAVFLTPGNPPMRKADFATAMRAQAGADAPRVEGRNAIREIRVLGDWAFLWQQLAVTITPPGGRPVSREGHTLTILNRRNGHWVLARDANLLGPGP